MLRVQAGVIARCRREDGATAVEFGLVLIPLLMLIFGIIQYGMYFFAMQSGSSAAREAARRVAVGDCQTSTELNTFIGNRLTGASVGGLVVARNYFLADGTATGTPTIGGRVTIDVTFNALDLHFPFIPLPAGGTVHRQVDARVEDLTANGTCA